MAIKNYIELPCGCAITTANHVMPCIRHAIELRKQKEDNEAMLSAIMMQMEEHTARSAEGSP